MNISEILRALDITITAEDVIDLIGLVLLGIWLLKTSLGTKALINSPPRRNDMPFYLPLVPLLIWLGGVPLAMTAKEKLLPNLQEWQKVLADNLIISVAAVFAIGVTIFLIREHFARRLKGFGLNPGTIIRDFFAAIVNLVSIYPIVLLAVVLTLYAGQAVWGKDFQLPQHEELKSIIKYPQLSVRILIIITATIVAPAFEEFLFRGLFQTLIRSYLDLSWPAIILSSILFAAAPPRDLVKSEIGPETTSLNKPYNCWVDSLSSARS